MKVAERATRWLPVLHWLKQYNTETFVRDLVASAIVSFMFLPQSLAYALLAGLPVEAGLYASIIPLMGYALFGSSRVLAVGPVAIISLMTASALGPLLPSGTPQYAQAALVLSLLSGLILLAMGMFRLGFLSNLLSHPVIAGFVTASSLIIMLSQVKTLLGVHASGGTLVELVPQIWRAAPDFNRHTLAIGMASIAFLIAARIWAEPMLIRLGLPKKPASILSRTGPLAAAAVFTVISQALDLPNYGVATVGTLPSGLPVLTVPQFDSALWRALLLPAVLMSIIGFVESVSVARTFAAQSRDVILPDRELTALGTANVLASLCGGMPVSGGFSRSVVNSNAGVQTPLASIFTGIGIAIVILFLVPVISLVPQAVLAATIIIAVYPLINTHILVETWNYSKPDFVAAAATILVTLVEGVELGVACGVVISILMYLYRTSRPHIAIVGLVPGTQHFRNIKRHKVITSEHILSVRIDESLYFANVAYLEEQMFDLVFKNPSTKHVILICSAVNAIDTSALEALERINQRFYEAGVNLHLSEVKGPVMDALRRTHFLSKLTGRIFLSHFHAIADLDPMTVKFSATQQPAEEVPPPDNATVPKPLVGANPPLPVG